MKGFALLIAVIVLTPLLGWVAVPLVALPFGFAVQRSGGRLPVPLLVGAWVSGAWGVLLIVDSFRGPVWEVAGRIGPIMALPPAALPVLALVFPGTVALAAAGVGEWLRSLYTHGPQGP